MIRIAIISLVIVVLVKVIKTSLNNRKSSEIHIKRGQDGERKVSNILSNLDRRRYIVFNDLLLKVNNSTTQIDHIVVSVYGVFVIETKNFTGCIYGKSSKYKWQRYSYNGKKLISEFYSPVKQNMAHIEMLSSVLGIDKYKFKSITCFVGATALKFIGDETVINDYELLDKIESNHRKLLSKREVKIIIEKLNNYVLYTIEDKKEHIKSVNEKKNRKSYGKCPYCGGNLVSRQSKTGEFIGCSNYPSCKYTNRI